MRRRRGRKRYRTHGRPDASTPNTVFPEFRRDIDWLSESVRPFSITLDQVVRERLERFCAELSRWNDRLNLLARTDVRNVVRKHVAASLGVLLVARPGDGERWIDVGTGGGFPGLVLYMACPWVEMTLLDSSRKRCLFLESVLRQLDLRPIRVLAMRAETHLAQGEGRGAYDVVTTRAVAALGNAVESFGPLLMDGGRMVTFKGPRWAEELAVARAGGLFERCRFEFSSATRIPWTQGHLLVFRKQGSSIPAYPGVGSPIQLSGPSL